MNLARIRDGCVVLAIFLVLLWVPACGDDEQRENNAATADQTLLEVARQVADTWIRTLDPEQIDWSWGDGVLMFGMSQLARRTGSDAYRNYIQAWMDHHIQEGYYFAFSDNCPVGISAVRLFEETGESRYREVTARIWNYLRNVADRTSDGGLNHMGFISGNQIWVDSLFMFGIYLNEMSRLLEDPVYWEELAGQIRVFSTHLRDSDNGLFLHMWDDDKQERAPVEDTFWARGNAWVFVMLVEFLTTLPEQGPLRQEFLPHLTVMAETLARLQPASGLWHTVLYDPETYQETSASALLAYGFHKAIRLGLLEAEHMEVVRKAMAGVQGRLYRGCNGGLIVSGTSHGTDPGEWEQYANITVGDQVPYGVGAVLLAAVEVGDWPAQGRVPLRTPCPHIPEDPQTPEEFLARAVYRLGVSDLEGAEEDFLALSALEPEKGEGPFGLALLQAWFAGFRAFDAFTRYTIDETSWSEFQEVIREETLPEMEEIRQKLIVARDDSTCYLHIPALTLNRRGLYTPITDLHYDSWAAGAALRLLDIAEWVLRRIS
jgi:unsaturated rhamnogalacturonyl hydrolase